MTRETKAGIAVSCVFVALVGAVAALKMRGGGDAPAAAEQAPAAVAEAKHPLREKSPSADPAKHGHGPSSTDESPDLSGGKSADGARAAMADLTGGKPSDASGGKPADVSGGKPADSNGATPVDLSGGKPADVTSGRPADLSGGKPADMTGGKPLASSGAPPVDLTGGKPADSAGGKPADATGGKPLDATGGKPADGTGALPSVDLTGGKPADGAAGKAVDAAGGKAADGTGATPVDLTGGKPADVTGGKQEDVTGGKPADVSGGKAADPTGAKTVDAAGGKPVDLMGGKPAAGTGGKSADVTGGGPTDATGGKPMDVTGGKPVDVTGSKPADVTGGKPAEMAGGKATDGTGAPPVDLSGGKPADATGAARTGATPADGPPVSGVTVAPAPATTSTAEGGKLAGVSGGEESEHSADHSKSATALGAGADREKVSEFHPSGPVAPVPGAGAAATSDASRLQPVSSTSDPGAGVAPPGAQPTARVLSATVEGGNVTRTDGGARPIATGSSTDRLMPTPATGPSTAVPVTPPVIAPVPATPLPAEGASVQSYKEEEYVCSAGDTLKSVSLLKYQSEDYAEALRRWNADKRQPTAVRPDGTLAPGQKLYVPTPASVLGKRYPDAVPTIKKAESRMTPSPAGVVPAAYATTATPPTVLYYKVRTPEPMATIARQTLGSSDRWVDLARLNPSSDPEKPLSPGTVLVMPAGAVVPPENAYTFPH